MDGGIFSEKPPNYLGSAEKGPQMALNDTLIKAAKYQERDWPPPAAKMKARRAHAVPLSRQVKEMLIELRGLTGAGKYVFPSAYGASRPMSENTLNASFRRMGFGKDEVTAHGLRATASTMLNESGHWNPDAIERALADSESNATRGAYHRGLYGDERVKMGQWWSDFLIAYEWGLQLCR